MKTGFPLLIALCLLACLPAVAQENRHGGIPDEVYYLLPSFGQGTVYFTGQAPAKGLLNICALDQSLRFLDKEGKELEAAEADNVIKVLIDTAVFLHYQDAFYRMYPLNQALGVAVLRDVQIVKEAKQAGYGTTSETSSAREYNQIYSDGVSYNLGSDKPTPYKLSETLFLYKGDDILTLNKRNLRKLFPEHKEEIDAWFKAGHALPDTVAEALETLSAWAQ